MECRRSTTFTSPSFQCMWFLRALASGTRDRHLQSSLSEEAGLQITFCFQPYSSICFILKAYSSLLTFRLQKQGECNSNFLWCCILQLWKPEWSLLANKSVKEEVKMSDWIWLSEKRAFPIVKESKPHVEWGSCVLVAWDLRPQHSESVQEINGQIIFQPTPLQSLSV